LPEEWLPVASQLQKIICHLLCPSATDWVLATGYWVLIPVPFPRA
jgi:hypothetical protein